MSTMFGKCFRELSCSQTDTMTDRLTERQIDRQTDSTDHITLPWRSKTLHMTFNDHIGDVRIILPLGGEQHAIARAPSLHTVK